MNKNKNNENIGTICNDTRSTAVNTIYCTKDYSMFKTQTGNRSKNNRHIAELIKSIKLENLLHAQPICVNEQFEIIDGQHRFQAAKEVGSHIYYYQVNGLGIKQTQRLNSNLKNWNADNFMHSFADNGIEAYIAYRLFYEQNCDIIDHNLAQVLLGNYNTYNGVYGQFFKDGNFIIKDWSLAVDHMNKIRDIHQQLLVIKGVPERRECMYALLNMFKDVNYNHSRMLQKLAIHPKDGLRILRRRSDFLVELCEIYNYRAGSEEKKANLNARLLMFENN